MFLAIIVVHSFYCHAILCEFHNSFILLLLLPTWDVSGLRYFKECLNEPPYACLFVSLSIHLCMLHTREGNAGS